MCRVVTDTFYDSRGWAHTTFNGWWDPSSQPTGTLVTADGLGAQVFNKTVSTFDGLCRPVFATSYLTSTPVSLWPPVDNGNLVQSTDSRGVNYGYTGVLDLPTSVGRLAGYALSTTYDQYGRPTQVTLGSAPNNAFVTNTYDPHAGWLDMRLVSRTRPARPTETQCFTYDHRCGSPRLGRRPTTAPPARQRAWSVRAWVRARRTGPRGVSMIWASAPSR